MKLKNNDFRQLLSVSVLIVAVCLFVAFAAGCGKKSTSDAPSATPSGSDEQAVTPTGEAPTGEAATPTEAPTPVGTEGKTIVIVFSQTGNTKRVAEVIARYVEMPEGAELYVIEAEVPYTSEDLNWNDTQSRTTKEQNDPSARPAIGSAKIDLTGCTHIFLGYPIWFGKEPRIMDTFVEGYDFTGITVIPFCTSGSSGIGTSQSNLSKLAGSGSWESGKRFAGTATEKEIVDWLMDSGYVARFPIDWEG
ncbi:MAG: flavodoxin [Lachnospiraceae bacterium]|nr:flavodoxin [Lachnospiraceae bacterium]